MSLSFISRDNEQTFAFESVACRHFLETTGTCDPRFTSAIHVSFRCLFLVLKYVSTFYPTTNVGCNSEKLQKVKDGNLTTILSWNLHQSSPQPVQFLQKTQVRLVKAKIEVNKQMEIFWDVLCGMNMMISLLLDSTFYVRNIEVKGLVQ